jgi:large subunit ribosomal protein L3
MGRKQGPRKGSMQFWPRSRSDYTLHSVNWRPVLKKHSTTTRPSVLGFIAYKAGMASAYVKDNTPESMTKGKRIIVPVTILECPPIKILSVRFYKNKNVSKEILNDNLDKELKHLVKMPAKKINAKEMIDKIKAEEFDDVRIVVYSQAKKTEIKKTPDILEFAVSGNSIGEKVAFIKENLAKEISVADVFSKGLVDIRGVTSGKGFSGAVERFGVHYRSHKAEKGQRKVGSIGGWHPIGVRFTVPRPGQMGYFNRVVYNSPIISCKKLVEGDVVAKRVFTNYGLLNTDYIILAGSVQGAQKRQVILTPAFRPTKRQAKRQYELLELR